ncbi:SLAC1 anion channel family protein [Mitsuaria sp. GD03876]|uniref:SLAC1 anion channel family protein n=1 Tax=Mitsuaria sp. GD03876 TaxID=2975399 RepID=UPI00244B20C3|nr:SLAC1 anion channel family protein [Mitsuaria sp. GD03876]MDH0865085.1 SLAC1 anion channel family protein [Mitsuaria sp. GD03876]
MEHATTIVNPQPASNPSRGGTASIRNLPVNLFGSVMGLSGLAMAWRLAPATFGVSPWVGEAIGALAVGVFLLLAAGYLAKFAKHRDAVLDEFRHPVAGNFFGTIAIAILLLSAVIGPYSEALGQWIWTVGTIVTFALSVVVVGRLLNGQVSTALAVPAWLIPGVATLDIAVTGGRMPMAWAAEVNLAALAVGTVMALVLYVLILSRLVHQEPLAKGMVPTLVVLVAPFAVGFLAYGNVFGIDRFGALLFYFGLFVFIVVAPKVFRREVPFAPSWWAISFPMAALSNAALKYAATQDAPALKAVALVLLVILTVAVAMLGWRTARIALNGKLLSA